MERARMAMGTRVGVDAEGIIGMQWGGYDAMIDLFMRYGIESTVENGKYREGPRSTAAL